MIHYIKKDVTTVERGVIAHGVNCQGKMGSGVAKALVTKWPAIFPPYEKLCKGVEGHQSELLGLCHMVNVGEEGNNLFVANCFTQNYYGKDGKMYADIIAVENSIAYAVGAAYGLQLPFYMPPIGCGLGGLNWERDVKPILEKIDQGAADLGTVVDIFVCDI